MIILGVNAQNHDASITVFDASKNEILFAGHSERYSRIKNDKHLNSDLIADALSYCDNQIDEVVWFENSFKKKLRYLRAGQYRRFLSDLTPEAYLQKFGINKNVILRSDHHLSHAAGGFYSSPFENAAVVVIDAIGEFSTTSAYIGQGSELLPIFNETYPHSLGLFYSAITELVGLKPNEEEYILMGMSAYGDATKYKQKLIDTLIVKTNDYRFKSKVNMHKGVSHLFEEDFNEHDTFDLAAAAQEIVEEHVVKLLKWVKEKTQQTNLVFSGGVALNCVANSRIAKECGFDNIWIMPNPGDAGNSLGAILNITRKHINFSTPYLGYNIDREFDMNGCLTSLCDGKIVGVANRRAEFGPRALGNRSLIADPRGDDIKDKMNGIKKRQKFRPFAPIILDRYANDYFDMPVTASPFMQFTARVKNPELFPAICHYDNTARVQTLTKEMNPQFYNLLERFFEQTGCPMLVNTSLNIKGEPLVNTWEDAERFSKKYGVEIY